MDIYEIANGLRECLDKNGIFAEVDVCNKVVKAEINWGDWKHDHLRCDYLTNKFAEGIGYELSVEVVETETDGSDCYSAIHFYQFDKK